MKCRSALAVSLLLVSVLGQSALAAHTRVTNPNAISFELLGRGLLYSVSYDRVLNDELAAGFGYGGVTTKVGDMSANQTASMIPAYINYYLAADQGSVYATAGAVLIANSSTAQGKSASVSGIDFTSQSVIPQFGLGYENRGDSGFLFRVTAYGMIANKFAPWAGFTFGYSF
jgi:hypothetical protein